MLDVSVFYVVTKVSLLENLYRRREHPAAADAAEPL
jgi:hypothetical protein